MDWLYPIRSVLNPAWYHGHGKKPPFFEGWYFKLIDRSGAQRYAIIPGVFLSQNPHAFIQVLNGRNGTATYHTFPLESFWASDREFAIHVGDSRFTAESISLNLTRPEQRIRGKLHFSGLTPWPVTLTAPGIMGWYAWVPTMECYHGVLSLDHAISGALEIDGETVDFGGGRGYIEKDWGQSFPAAWIWMQSNHFAQPGTSLTASIAIIPWRRTSFRGFIVGFWHEGQLHRFATYNGAQVEKLAVTQETATWVLRNKTHRLAILAHLGKEEQFGLLKGPDTVEMGKRVAESLTAEVEVQLSQLTPGKERTLKERVLFTGNGRYAGLEVHNTAALLTE